MHTSEHYHILWSLFSPQRPDLIWNQCWSQIPSFLMGVFCHKLDIGSVVVVMSGSEGRSSVLFVPQAMRLQQANLWYLSSFDRSRSVETSQSSSPSSQHSSLAAEAAAQPGRSSPRYLTASVHVPNGFCFSAHFSVYALHNVYWQNGVLTGFKLQKGLNEAVRLRRRRIPSNLAASFISAYANEILSLSEHELHQRERLLNSMKELLSLWCQICSSLVQTAFVTVLGKNAAFLISANVQRCKRLPGFYSCRLTIRENIF